MSRKRSYFDELIPVLPHVEKPSRYLPPIHNRRGGVAGAEVKWALAFPDVAESGHSHHGLEILYNLLNNRDDCAAERVFSPWPDMEEEMRSRSIPLLSSESATPVREFDIIGITLQFELSYTNVLGLIDLAGLPLRSKDRPDVFPLVVAGGPCATNPEPLAPFIDFFLIGEGEEGVEQITEVVRRFKRGGGGKKKDLLRELTGVSGVYVPEHFEVRHEADGTIRSIEGAAQPTRAILSDLSQYPGPADPAVSAIEPIHDRVYAEIARGCGVGCRFCQAGYIYRPLRERSVAEVTKTAAAAFRSTGHSDITLASLSSGDHSDIVPILRELNRELREETVSLSLPSLRACTLRDEVIHEVSGNRKSSFTIAPEAGSERMLRLINKGITRDHVLDTTERVVRQGWSLLKLYFLIGLPTEEDEDVDGIATLANDVCRIGTSIAGRKFRLNVSVSNLVPKAHTPFQWEAQDPVDLVLRKQKRIRSGLRSRAINLKCHNAPKSAVEDILARGDRRLADVLEKLYLAGTRFEEWSERFSYQVWYDAMSELGIDPDFYHRERPEGERFPWDHIDVGITQKFLIRERHRGRAARGTPFCREECRVCRSCDDDTFVIRNLDGENSSPEGPAIPPSPPEGKYRFRFRFTKIGIYRFLSQLEVLRAFRLALRRSGLPVGMSQGFHPRQRISFGRPLAVGQEGSEEPLEIVFHSPIDPEEAEKKLNAELPEGISVFDCREVPLHGPALDSLGTELIWEVTIPGKAHADSFAAAIGRFLEKDRIVVEQPWKKKVRSIDIRAGVKEIRIAEDGGSFVIRSSMNCKIRQLLLYLAGEDQKLLRSLMVRRTLFQIEGENRKPIERMESMK